VVIGLSQAVVVVEAGETGGTLRAGEVALRSGRRLLATDFAERTPQGNAKLIAAGARRIINRVDLAEELRSLRLNQDTQLTLG
jgi:DNA processing protein